MARPIRNGMMEGHWLIQRVACGDLIDDNPSLILSKYELQAEPVIGIHWGKAIVRLAHLLRDALR